MRQLLSRDSRKRGFQTAAFLFGVAVQPVNAFVCVRNERQNRALAAVIVRQVLRHDLDRRRVAVKGNLCLLQLVLRGFQCGFGGQQTVFRGGNLRFQQVAVLQQLVLAAVFAVLEGLPRGGKTFRREHLPAGRTMLVRKNFRVNRTPAGTVIV